jgi:hypothetical protein
MIIQEFFNTICLVWIATGVIMFPVLLKVTQPYGRHSKSNWGPLMNNRMAWILMELPALAVFGYFLLYKHIPFNAVAWVAVMLWGLHYIHRVLIFPFQIRSVGKKMPVVIVMSGIFFNTVNGFLNGYWLGHFVNENPSGLFFSIRLVAGIILFLAGFVINKYHDRILIQLRDVPGKGYKIPFGGLFKYISCPNFLGEIISWLGFFVVTMGLPALSFLIWSIVNLTARALDHHKWYRHEFPEYPKERKAIFPYML